MKERCFSGVSDVIHFSSAQGWVNPTFPSTVTQMYSVQQNDLSIFTKCL